MKTSFNPALKAALFRPMRATRGIVRSCCRSERGVTAVEFAITIPFVLLVLSGIIQFGFVLFLQSHVADVARETARRVAVGDGRQPSHGSRDRCLSNRYELPVWSEG